MSSPSASTIDLATLPPAVAERVLRELRWATRDVEEREMWKDLCDNGTDEEIIAEGQKYANTQAVEVADTYGGGEHHIFREQEILYWAVFNHPRRPVLMRGARGVRVARYAKSTSGSPNGWAERIAERAIRMKKLNAFDGESFDEQTRELLDALGQRYCLSYHFTVYEKPPYRGGRYSPLWRDEACLARVSGKPVWLNGSERKNIQALQKIIAKFDKLEDRKAAAIKKMRERLAS